MGGTRAGPAADHEGEAAFLVLFAVAVLGPLWRRSPDWAVDAGRGDRDLHRGAENHAHEMGKDALTEADWYDNLRKKLTPVDPDHSE
jgi:hypothetical protein